MPILLKTRVERAAKTPVTARRTRVGGLRGLRSAAERVPNGNPKPAVAPVCGSVAKAASAGEKRLWVIFGREKSRKRRSRRKA